MTVPSEIRNLRYLITGASGFIGRAVCEQLLARGALVFGTSRRIVEIDSPGWHHSVLDLGDADAVDELLDIARPHYVIHLASCVTGKREIDWIRATMTGNLGSAVNLLVAAQKSGVGKIVLAGSLEEPEESDARPVAASPYAVSKWCASSYARTMHALYGLRVSVARIFMVYGPGQQDLAKLVPYVCTAAATGESPQLMSGGRPVDWIYIADVVDGLIAMTVAGPDDGSYVELGSGQLVTTGDVAGRICEIAATGVQPELGALPDRAMEQVRVADVSATESLINWRTKVDLDSGLALTYEWYKQLALGSQADRQKAK